MRLLNIFHILLFLGSSFVSQAQISSFFTDADVFFQANVINGLVDYQNIHQNPIALNSLRQQIADTDLSNADDSTLKAFYINTYNILVIGQVIDNYPISSPLKVSGFFERQKYTIAGEQITLNELEKDKLLGTYQDSRFHFVLVCGALDCPPIINRAYLPSDLESLLEQQTRLALNDQEFIKVEKEGIALSQIFEWYAKDFGGSKNSAIDFINQYRTIDLPKSTIRFYDYNWALNQIVTTTNTVEAPVSSSKGNNAARYVVSASIPKGSFEIKGFTNLYNQVTGNGDGPATDQYTFFTQNLSVLYGVNNRFNGGFDLRYRQVSVGPESIISRFDVFNLEQTSSTRQGLTGVGPKIRYAPFVALPNLSIQSTYWFAIGEDLAGNAERPFIDFNGDTWFTQIFNDFSLGDNFSFFTELDILLEDIGKKEDGHLNRFSTPVQLIFSYFPNSKTTIYSLGSFSPYWQNEFDFFYQAGVGAKYQITPKLEVELLYTQFRNQFILDTNGSASTMNFGLRVSVF